MPAYHFDIRLPSKSRLSGCPCFSDFTEPYVYHVYGTSQYFPYLLYSLSSIGEFRGRAGTGVMSAKMPKVAICLALPCRKLYK